MKLDVSYRHINKESYQSTRNKLKDIMQRHLEPHVATFNASQLRLHATVEKQKLDYRIILRLHLPPKKVLIARAEHENMSTAITDAVDEIARQAKRHHAHISGRAQWKRKQRRQRMKGLQAEIQAKLPAEKQHDAEQRVTPLLPRIENYIRHELTYLRANGDLLPTYPSLEDIRDEALIQLKFNWNKLESKNDALYQELLKSVHSVLQKEVELTRLHSKDVSTEAFIPKDAMDQAEEMVGEESTEFFQPFETLHIEDLIPDTHEAMPEELSEKTDENKQAREACYQLMGNMPAKWRHIILLVYQQGVSVDDIAQNVLSFSLTEAENLLHKAESFLLDSLVEQGHENINREVLFKLLKV